MLSRCGPDFTLDSIFAPFDLTRREAIIAAVSGGSDSLAMLLLLQRWLERSPSTRLIAATVDHGLRKASSSEAQAVAEFCAQRGIEHRMLVWRDEKPLTGRSAASRIARYTLLAGAAEEEGCDVVVTGHTADDQAETVTMRQARGAGRGLAGMAPATLFDGRVWIARPLLSTTRTCLRDFLKRERVDWIDDPSNDDPRYERSRTRMALSGGDGRRGKLVTTAHAAARTRATLAGEAGRLIDSFADRPVPGLFRLDRGILAGEDGALLTALRILLAVCGGAAQLPDETRAHALMCCLREQRHFRATLSRTVVDARSSGIFLYRERRGLPERQRAVDETIWDGRYRLAVLAPDVVVVPGTAAEAALEGQAGGAKEAPASVVSAAAAAHPRFFGASGVEIQAVIARAVPVMSPWRLFLPSFDLAAVQATAALLGLPKLPRPPFAEHNKVEA